MPDSKYFLSPFHRSILTVCLLFFVPDGIVHSQWVQVGLPPAAYVSSLATSGKNLLAGTDGGAYISPDSGLTWTQINNGLTSTFVEGIASSDTVLYCATHGGGVFRSANNGGAWTPINNGLTNLQVGSIGANGKHLIAGTWGTTFLSTNAGGNWAPISAGLTYLYAYAFAVSGPNLFAGTWDFVALATDSGYTWTIQNRGITNPWVFSLALSGSNVLAGTYGGIFRSTDAGFSWNQVNNGLSNLSVLCVAAAGNTIVAGTYGGGVFLSTNGGTNWVQVNTGLGNTYVKSLAFIGADIVAGTYYGGAWRIRISDLLASPTTFPVNAGWNLVSLPRAPADARTSSLLPGVSPGTVYRFGGGNFQQAGTMTPGEGYWALYDSAGINAISGTAFTNWSLTVPAGNRWVLIGALSTSIPAVALASNPPGALAAGTLWGWNGTAYVQPSTIDPGRGYWVFVNAPCTLSLSLPGTSPAGKKNQLP